MREQPAAGRARSEAGSLSVAMPLVVILALVVIGFAFDASNALTAKRRGINIAEQAARAGAGQLDLASIRSGGAYRIDPTKARLAAQNYLATAGYSGQVRLGRDAIGDRVDVSVTWTQEALFERFVGVGRYGGTAEASAHVCHGVLQEEGC
jgi:Flp pilus assembly protein TadG